MIIPKGIKPESSLYYLGAEILERMRNIARACDAYILFEDLKKEHKFYSINQHLMALNWLHLLGAVRLDDEGRLELC